MKKILNKIKTQINTLIYIIIFTWEVTLVIACQIYNIMIKSAMTHSIIAWHMNSDTDVEKVTCQSYKNNLIKKLIKIQNKYL